MAMAPVKAHFGARGAGQSRFTLTITVHGRMYHAIGALRPPSEVVSRFESVYIDERGEAALNRKKFYGELREDLLCRL